jgi:S-adenosylmethionine:tRNA ribosyltransferase-isomerase
MHQLSDYEYDLPESFIAQDLASPADSARLLVFNRSEGTISDHTFHELPSLIPEWSHLFFNTSKVVKARIPFPEFDGEIFFLKKTVDEYTFEALVKQRKKMRVWQIHNVGKYTFEITGMTYRWRTIKSSHPIFEILEDIGQMPLPPYITYDESKSNNYQALQAKQPGSVAAPTASLHFTQKTFDDLKNRNCTMNDVVLHIWLWTFIQVDTETIEDFDIHSEYVEITPNTFEQIAIAKRWSQPLIGVWTTVARTLESLPYLRVLFNDQAKSLVSPDTHAYREELTKSITQDQANTYIKSWKITGNGTINSSESWWYDIYPKNWIVISFESTLYIYPWFEYMIVDQLVTNFHLPRSSLLMLVAGFVWYNNMLKIYQHAIQNKYMFYSFGDGMLIK